MDKEQKELEIKKLELEKAKVLEGLLRTIAIMLLTIGAGIGTLMQKLYPDEIKKFLLVILISLFIAFTILFIFIWIRLEKIIKELKRWIY